MGYLPSLVQGDGGDPGLIRAGSLREAGYPRGWESSLEKLEKMLQHLEIFCDRKCTQTRKPERKGRGGGGGERGDHTLSRYSTRCTRQGQRLNVSMIDV